MPPRTKLWKLEPHTLGKHYVLRNYLEAWFPIMGNTFDRILFIDGFAGPGEYVDGQDGSPIIALNTYVEHVENRRIKAEVVFSFVEEDAERAAHLRDLIERRKEGLPKRCKVFVEEGAFDENMTNTFEYLEKNQRKLAPSFVMIDPFGVKGTPMRVVQKIFMNKSAEVYVSFMYESINRFKETPEFGPHLDELFGSSEWRQGLSIKDPVERKDFFYNLYETQLRKSGAKHVLRLELLKGAKVIYALFFATTHWIGADRMKAAIWKVAPFGDFAFHGTKVQQLTLGTADVDYRPLAKALGDTFRSKGWVSIEAVEEFVGSDQTDFHTGQLRKPVLIPMETEGTVQVRVEGVRKKNTYPKGRTTLRFV